MTRPATRDLLLLACAALLLPTTAACSSDGSVRHRDAERRLDWQLKTMRKHFDRDVANTRDHFTGWDSWLADEWDGGLQRMRDTSSLYLGEGHHADESGAERE